MQKIVTRVEFINPPDYKTLLDTVEKVGRTCYKSEDKMTDNSAEGFIRRLIARKHGAIIEHASVTLRFFIDRGVSHEAVRHRIASYGQESTRYCNYLQEKFGSEVTYIDLRKGMELDTKVSQLDHETFELIYSEWVQACEDAERHYFRMLRLGATPQIARSVLNNSTKTELCVTMNMREWRHFCTLRCDITAHPQMREAAQIALDMLYTRYPVFFEDIANKEVAQ